MNTQKLIKKYGPITVFQRAYREGDGDGGDTGGQGANGANGDTFTQDDINRFLAEDRRKNEKKFQKQIDDLQKQMQTMKETGSAEAQEQFEQQIESMRQQFLTKEQKLQEKIKAEEKQRTQEVNNLQKERDQWKGLYAETRITNELQTAVTSGKVKPTHPNVVVDLLKPKTTLEPVIGDDGSPTGELAPKVAMKGEQDGKPVTLSLSPAEAVERMATDTANYGSLFASQQKGGITTGTPGMAVIGDVESYTKFRESGQHRQIGATK